MIMPFRAIPAAFAFSAALALLPDEAPPAAPTSPPAVEPAEPPPAFAPIRVSFRLADGVLVRGDLTAWDADGIDGSFARRRWTELHVEDVWTLGRRLIDRERPEQWIALGRVLLLAALDQPDGADRAARRADQAFERARRLATGDAEGAAAVDQAIEIARDDVVAERLLREEEAEAERAWTLRTESPEADPWSPDPWPELDAEEQTRATAAIRADAARILEKAGRAIEPVETEFFLFYSDLDRRESARWASELDRMYALLAERFGRDPKRNIFWGKCAIFVWRDRDRFRLVEAESFRHFAPEWAVGIFHPLGARCFVNFYRPPREEVFAAVLVHETTHAFLHRHGTPRRLPTWANEGICDYMAAVLFRGSVVDLERRRTGTNFVRRGGDVNAVLDWSYGGGWPGPGEIGYDVGYLLVELMIRDRPAAFGAWVDAIKAGKAWETALEEDFGVDRAALVDAFVRYYRVND